MPRQNIYRTDPILTNVALQYRNQSYIKPMLFPDTGVPQASGRFFKYDPANNLSGNEDDTMSIDSRSSSMEDEYNVTRLAFGPIPKRSRKIFVPDDDVKLAPNPLTPRQDATEVVSDRYDLRAEIQAASIMTNSSNFGSTTTKSGTGQWNDYSNSDPVADIEAGVEAVYKGAVIDADTIVMTFQTWRVLRRHPKLVGLFTYTSAGYLRKDQFMELLSDYGINKLIIAKNMKNTANTGQTASLDYIWGKHCWILRTGDGQPRPKEVTWGRNLVVDGFKKQVQTHPEWDPDGEWIRVQGQELPWIFAKEAGYAIYNAIA